MVEILRLCIEMGGSIIGEHGVGVDKRDHLPEQFDEIELRAMTRIGLSVDVREVVRRGKVLVVSGDGAPAIANGGVPVAGGGVPAAAGGVCTGRRRDYAVARCPWGCLPFDPPLVAAGTTLGGTVAFGLSGPWGLLATGRAPAETAQECGYGGQVL